MAGKNYFEAAIFHITMSEKHLRLRLRSFGRKINHSCCMVSIEQFRRKVERAKYGFFLSELEHDFLVCFIELHGRNLELARDGCGTLRHTEACTGKFDRDWCQFH